MLSTKPLPSPQHDEEIFRKACASENVDSAYHADLTAIFQFMHDHEKVDGCLDRLEESLQQYAANLEDQSGLTHRNGRYHLAPTNTEYQQCHKILSGFFYQWAQENGFQRKAKIIDALPSESFLNLLTQQSIFKDSTAMLNVSHGMWSHTIQWFCIFEYQRQSNVLQHSPMNIYQQLGSINPRIWNYLLDRMDVKFYHCPEYLTNSIIAKPEHWPLLSATLTRQKEKLLWGMSHRGAYQKHLLAKHTADAHDGVIIKPLK